MARSASLTNQIYDRIAAKSAECAKAWKARSANISQTSIENQLAAVNSFWRIQLGQLRINTIPQRECLQDDIAIDVWLNNFETYVIPVIVKYKLPV